MPSVYLWALSAALLASFVLYRARRARRSLKYLRGPPSSSYWLGNMKDILYQAEVGDVEFKWMHEYGGAWRISACMGEEYLMLTDPKALQYILHTSGYRFPKREDTVETTRLLLGQGLVWAHGETHQRQRKIMNPAFTAPQLRSFLGVFQQHGTKLVQKWKDEMNSSSSDASIMNIVPWFSRVTLDIIGVSGFNYEFGALDNAENEVSEAYRGLLVEGSLYPSKLDVVFKSFWKYIPAEILHLVRFLPATVYVRFRRYTTFMGRFAPEVFRRNEAQREGELKDVISVLQRANSAEDPAKRLNPTELYDQISTILLAGHDTTSYTLTWFFWELSKHTSWQTKIRDEVMAMRHNITARGDTDPSAADLDGMPFLNAALKESMRLHPIVWWLARTAANDDVIPLAFPVSTKTGETIDAIPVRKGQAVHISVSAYNRMPEIWGEDAQEFNPDRFLGSRGAKQTSVGVYANLLNFSGGLRACIGWRFSILEQQALAAMLLENFEFSLPREKAANDVKRKPSLAMLPIIDSEPGSTLFLDVKSLQ
ncbi:cytochrome P450 [Dentipellis sp. KUC8613]|nr:cytochrome P450 [Dentipellis sp. KUC8613]